MSQILNRNRYFSTSRIARGFTLIEVMIVVAIVAILATIALPNYRDYILRGQLVDGTNGLAAFRANMERYYQDNRTYAATGANVPPCDASLNAGLRTVGTFLITCNGPGAPTTTAYTLQAAGSGATNNFIFTVNETGAQQTTSIGMPGWGTVPATCWLVKRGQTC